MKKTRKAFFFGAILACFLVLLAGCATATAPTPAVAPGYFSPADQKMGQTLGAIDAYYHTVQCETKMLNWSVPLKQCVADPAIISVIVLSPAEKTVMNDLGIGLNVANASYLAFHQNPTPTTQAQAQANIDAAWAKQNAAQSMGVKP